jgi:hypothetical protein
MTATKQDILDAIKDLRKSAEEASSEASDAASSASEISSYASDAESFANRAESKADEVLDLLSSIEDDLALLTDTDVQERKSLVLSALIQWTTLFNRITSRIADYDDLEVLSDSDRNALLNIERIASQIRYNIDAMGAYDRLTIVPSHTGDVQSLLMFTTQPADYIKIRDGSMSVRVSVERS